MNKCAYINNKDVSCNAFTIKESIYCFRHDPNNKEKSLLASQKGGENRRLQGRYGSEIKLESSQDVKEFLSKVINAVWIGEVPVQVGTSMGFLTRCWLDANEAVEIEDRLNLIEQHLESTKWQKTY